MRRRMRGLVVVGMLLLGWGGASRATAGVIWRVVTSNDCTAQGVPGPCCAGPATGSNVQCNKKVAIGDQHVVFANFRTTDSASNYTPGGTPANTTGDLLSTTAAMLAQCTASVTPYPCCTGVGTGTCIGEFSRLGLDVVNFAVCSSVQLSGTGANQGWPVTLVRQKPAAKPMGGQLAVKLQNLANAAGAGTAPTELGVVAITQNSYFSCILYGY